jgi:gluconolactonase
MKHFGIIIFTFSLISCNHKLQVNTYPTEIKYTGTILKYDDELDAVITADTKPVILADGFDWSEGPLWIEKHQMLLFSDVPKNTIYKWTTKNGLEEYLKPSGYTGVIPSKCKEPGSNGLTLDPAGNLVLCQHGDRQMSRMNAPLHKPQPSFTKIASTFENRCFSSPNDCVYNSRGELFFTDPPYGLQTQDDTDPLKEIKYNGVYKIKPDGSVLLLVDSITRPNGLAFFPGEKKILIACSDPHKKVWYSYDVQGDKFVNEQLFFDATSADKTWRGLPDGLKINKKGIVFATGPGGVYILNKNGKKLGIIRLENSASNCAFSEDEKLLYVTNDMYLLRVQLK